MIVLIAALACARATRLIVKDSILDRPRTYWQSEAPEWLTKLLDCPWCISGWLTLAVIGWYWSAHTLAAPLLAWGAVWWITCVAYWLAEALSKVEPA